MTEQVLIPKEKIENLMNAVARSNEIIQEIREILIAYALEEERLKSITPTK